MTTGGYAGGSNIYYQIDHADFYYLSQEGGSLAGTLTRAQYSGYTQTPGEYLNVEDRSGVATTYDQTFTALRTGEYVTDFGEYEPDDELTETLSDSTGYGVYSFYGNYARFYNYDTKTYGIMDRYGNIIIPAQLDYVNVNYYSDSYEENGYFAGSVNGNFVYLTAGGTVTGNFSYSYDDVYNYGMSARYKTDDGSYILLSGDGKETNLGTTCEYLDSIRESGGMFWIGRSSSGYDLLDWHGNVLISGSDGLYYGVIDTKGNLVVPTEYDYIGLNFSSLSSGGIWANGYFAVEKDGLAGYVTSGGQVTCEMKYDADDFYSCGMAGYYEAADGSYTIVAADGTETAGLSYPTDLGGYGKSWEVYQNGEYSLLDWHGNVIFEGFRQIDVSYDDQYIIVQQNSGDTPQLYTVDGAVVEGLTGSTAGGTSGTDTAQQESAAETADAAQAENGAGQTAQTDAAAQTGQTAQTDAAAQTGQTAQTDAAAQTGQTAQTDAAAQTGQTAQTDAAAADTNAAADASADASGTDNSAAVSLLNAAKSLVDTDMTANADSILVLLQQAKTILDTANPDAAAVVGSAITLMQSGAADAGSIGTLISTAAGLL